MMKNLNSTPISITASIPSELNIHENQYLAGCEIISYFKKKHNVVILTAQMQSGKTGVAKYITYYYKSIEKIVDIFYICGMNDNDLKRQAIEEFKSLLPKSNILFSKDLFKATNNFNLNLTDSMRLIIIDESHYAKNKNSLIDKFIKQQKKFNPLTYILSISATACAEIAVSNITNTPIVYLNPGKGYYGIEDLYNEKLIFQSINLNDGYSDWKAQKELSKLIYSEFSIQTDSSVKKYNIIRLPSINYYQDLEETIISLFKENDDIIPSFINYHSKKMVLYDFNNIIKNEPEKFTIIWIYGALRASKQLDTTHIGFVHDTFKSKPDTVGQSLMGRIFGYKKDFHGVNCYTDLSSANGMLKWISNKYMREYIPVGSSNIINGYSINNSDFNVKWKLNKPIQLVLTEELIEYYSNLKFRYKNRYPYKKELFDDIIKINPDLDEILNSPNFSPGKHGGLMILTINNKDNSFRENWDLIYNAWKNNDPVRGFDTTNCNNDNYYYVFVNLNNCSKEKGMVLITYKFKLHCEDITVADYVRVNNKSRFSI